MKKLLAALTVFVSALVLSPPAQASLYDYTYVKDSGIVGPTYYGSPGYVNFGYKLRSKSTSWGVDPLYITATVTSGNWPPGWPITDFNYLYFSVTDDLAARGIGTIDRRHFRFEQSYSQQKGMSLTFRARAHHTHPRICARAVISYVAWPNKSASLGCKYL